MRPLIYFDTSALAKWYLNEAQSDEVEQYIQAQGPVAISDLTVVEMRCLLARRRRAGDIDFKTEMQVFATFEEDRRLGALHCFPLPQDWAAGAVHLLTLLADLPLRTLDTLHLFIAQDIQADVLATADRVMAMGGEALGFTVVRFDLPKQH